MSKVCEIDVGVIAIQDLLIKFARRCVTLLIVRTLGEPEADRYEAGKA